MNKQHTISDGRQALSQKVAFHRAELQRFERMVQALDEAEKALNSPVETNGARGRPKDSEGREKLLVAISKLPEKFSRKEAEAETPGVADFGRIFREACDDGLIITEIPAMGRQPGVYKKAKGPEALETT